MKVLLFLIGIPVAFIGYLRNISIENPSNDNQGKLHELSEYGNLLDSEGRLIESGFAKKALKQFNPQGISPWNKMIRLKQWDYYHLSTEELYLAIAFVDIGYTQSIQITYYSLTENLFIHKDALILPLVGGTEFRLLNDVKMSGQESKQYEGKELKAYYRGWKHGDIELRQIDIQFDGFNATFTMESHPSNVDELYQIKKFTEEGEQFFYSRKAYNWNTYGRINTNNRQYQFKGVNGGMDWGRGVFPYATSWLWMSGQGSSNGTQIGFNLGAGNNGVGSASDEVILIDKRLYNLADLVYDYSRNDIITAQTRNCNRDALKLGEFYVKFERLATHLVDNDWIVIDIKFRQMIGTYSGKYMRTEGLVQFDGIVGIVELNKAKW